MTLRRAWPLVPRRALESRVLVSARRLRVLGAGSETVDIEEITQVEGVARALQSAEPSPVSGEE